MKTIKILSFVLSAVLGVCLMAADPNAKAQIIAGLMKSQPGGPKPVMKDGKMVGFFVVGVAPIPRSMPKNRAKAYARKAARRDAEKKVSQFFNTSVRMSEDANGETVMTVAGEAAGDTGPAASKESSASVDRTSETFKKVSAAALSGLEGEGYEINDGELVEVYSWSAAKSQALRSAIRNMGKTADVGVKTANKVEQSRATGATESPRRSAPASAAAPAAPIGAGTNTAPANTTKVAPDVSSAADFF